MEAADEFSTRTPALVGEPRSQLVPLAAAWAVVVGIGASGCPTYEDTYSGTYREKGVNAASATRAIQVDLFRFGNNVSSVLRFYEPSVENGDEQPFAREKFCVWTDGGSFDTGDRTFRLPVDRGSRIPESTLHGKLVSESQLEITVIPENSEEPFIETTQLTSVENGGPDASCDSVGTFLVTATFELRGGERNRMPSASGYDVKNPVFSLQWVGIQARDNFTIPVNAQGPTRRLDDSTFVDGKNGTPDELKGNLKPNLAAPPENVLSSSGDTRYAIGHPVVIDDSESTGSFTWEAGAEPIVASALQRGVPADVQTSGELSDVNGSGKAILFVEGSISELSARLRTAFFEKPQAIANGTVPDSHFYVVDILYARRAGAIRRLTLPQTLTQHAQNRSIPMKMTERYIGEDGPSLPRVSSR